MAPRAPAATRRSCTHRRTGRVRGLHCGARPSALNAYDDDNQIQPTRGHPGSSIDRGPSQQPVRSKGDAAAPGVGGPMFGRGIELSVPMPVALMC